MSENVKVVKYHSKYKNFLNIYLILIRKVGITRYEYNFVIYYDFVTYNDGISYLIVSINTIPIESYMRKIHIYVIGTTNWHSLLVEQGLFLKRFSPLNCFNIK